MSMFHLAPPQAVMTQQVFSISWQKQNTCYDISLVQQQFGLRKDFKLFCDLHSTSLFSLEKIATEINM